MNNLFPYLLCALAVFSGCARNESAQRNDSSAVSEIAEIKFQLKQVAAENEKLLKAVEKFAEFQSEQAKSAKTLLGVNSQLLQLEAAIEKQNKFLTEFATVYDEKIKSLTTYVENREELNTGVRTHLLSELSKLRLELYAKANSSSAASLHPASKSFSLSRNTYGVFPISLENAQPYLTGFKVTFRVGNPTSAKLLDSKLSITYGPTYPNFPDEKLAGEAAKKAWDEYNKAFETAKARSKEAVSDAIAEIRSGSWTDVEVILQDTPPELLGRVEVLLETKGLSLNAQR